MSTTLGVAEILEQISKIKDINERQNALSTCAGTPAIIQVLHSCFHPEVKFQLPEGRPPFNKMEKRLDLQGSFYREARKLHFFIEGLSPNINQLKRETMFVQFLEVLDPDDAELMIAIKDKQMPYKGITYDLVKNTFPGLLPDRPAEEGNVPPKGKLVPCPFGCKSSREDGLYSPGPLAMHIRNAHAETTGSSENGEEGEDVMSDGGTQV